MNGNSAFIVSLFSWPTKLRARLFLSSCIVIFFYGYIRPLTHCLWLVTNGAFAATGYVDDGEACLQALVGLYVQLTCIVDTLSKIQSTIQPLATRNIKIRLSIDLDLFLDVQILNCDSLQCSSSRDARVRIFDLYPCEMCTVGRVPDSLGQIICYLSL